MIGRERLGFNEEVLEMAAGVAGQGQIGLFFLAGQGLGLEMRWHPDW